MTSFPRYATFENFGDPTESYETIARRPMIASVVVPESIKRRLPSKYYVYKVVVQWSNGSTTVVYRRYSLFFDFMVKLQELYAKLCHSNPKFTENLPQLPELPGKILFGRSQIHQVAEKRRRKIEEFCQHLITLPPEISESSLVLGFFNTWPDDTLLHPEVTSPREVERSSSPILLMSPTYRSPSPTTPSHSTPQSTSFSSSWTTTDAIITHPDEMEHLEQYRVIADYQRKDSHQVDLNSGQTVHVIEKHDTGWWMVMAEDEQGYAPASYLEPMGGKSDAAHPESNTSEVYEAMESYEPENDDEVGFKAGDRIEVLSKSMDGWWKIRCNGKVGYSPAALIRRKTLPHHTKHEAFYESEKSIYEGLNIHRPPPRRNTIDRQNIIKPNVRLLYDIPRPNPAIVKLVAGDDDHDYVDPASDSESEDENYYKVPMPSRLLGETKVNGMTSAPVKSREDRSRSNSGSPPRQQGPIQATTTTLFERQSSDQFSQSPPSQLVGEDEEHIYEMEPTPTIPIYENAQVAIQKNSSHPLPPLPLPKARGSNVYQDDYVDLDAHNTYVNPSELQNAESMGSLDVPVTPGTPSTPSTTAVDRPLPKPPLPASDPPKTRPKIATSRSQSADSSSDKAVTTNGPRGGMDSVDDEYIEMDPIYSEPPEEEEEKEEEEPKDLQPVATPSARSPTKAKSPSRPIPPAPPQPYALHKSSKKSMSSNPLPVQKEPLARAKSLEDLLSSSSKEQPAQRQHSPPSNRRIGDQPLAKVPLLPSHLKERNQSEDRDFVDGNIIPIAKPKPAKLRAGKGRKPIPNGQPPIRMASQPEEQRLDLLRRNARSPSPHKPLSQTISAPSHPAPTPTPQFQQRRQIEASLPKTYFAISSYASQVEGCLSFREGDRCVLLQKTRDGWWLVNIGGREGWTPGDFWQEEMRSRVATMAQPPAIAPLRLPERKPRSLTVGESSSTDLGSSMEWSQESSSQGIPSLTSSVEAERLSLSGSTEISRPTPPPVSAKPGKAKGPPPPKPKPLLTAGSPLNKRKLDKPPVPQKPIFNRTTGIPPKASPSTSPPTPRKNSEGKTPSPPPPSHVSWRRGSAPQENGVVHSPPGVPRESQFSGEYVLLAEARTNMNAIETFPWFVGKMERIQAEQFLKEYGRQREFLVRERTAKDGYYALSIRYHYNFKHFNIDPTTDGQYSMGTLTFPNIEDIIHHYQQNSLFIHDGQHVTLGQPVRRRTRPSDSTRPHV